MKLLWLLHFNRTILIHTPPMERNKEEKENEHVRNSILIHTPSMGRNRRICDIRTHSVPRFAHYANQWQHLTYSQLHGVYILEIIRANAMAVSCALYVRTAQYIFPSMFLLPAYTVYHTAAYQPFLQTN